MKESLDLTNMVFHRLSVLNRHPVKTKNNAICWDCICVCGNLSIVTTSNLLSGTVLSCGCWAKEISHLHSLKHGATGTPIYNIWKSIKQRTCNPNNADYPAYGGKNIQMFDEWKNSFESFQVDMGPRPSEKHSIDRYPNNSGNYEPGNCRWATQEEQANNKSNNVRYLFEGVEQTVVKIAEKEGISKESLRKRLSQGQNIETVILDMKNNKAKRKQSVSDVKVDCNEPSEIRVFLAAAAIRFYSEG